MRGFADRHDGLAAPFNIEHAVSRLGCALWPYLYLTLHANQEGRVCRARAVLATDLQVPEGVVQEWLDRLITAGLLEALSPAPYLVLKLGMWRGGESPTPLNSAETEPQAGPQKSAQSNVPVSSSLLLPDSFTSKPIDRGVNRGLGEGEGLLGEAQAILGLADVMPLRELIAGHPPSVVRQALARVAATPAEQIRKSRFALFRYLLKTLPTTSPHDHDPPH